MKNLNSIHSAPTRDIWIIASKLLLINPILILGHIAHNDFLMYRLLPTSLSDLLGLPLALIFVLNFGGVSPLSLIFFLLAIAGAVCSIKAGSRVLMYSHLVLTIIIILLVYNFGLGSIRFGSF